MTLAPQIWMERPGASAILTALGAQDGVTRLVGGVVRDALLGLAIADIDAATRLMPDEVVQRLEAAGLKAVPTGIAHGTVTAIAAGTLIEVTTLRRDVSTDGRRATVAFTDDWRADAARRDFTINALYADPTTGELFDYFGGLEDLSARRVRFIGVALKRIAEDHLRILRFFRFHARFGVGSPDAEGLAACAARANDLMALSRERVRDELLKLLCVPDPVPALRLMLDHAILAPVLPEITAERLPDLARLVAVEACAGAPCVGLRRLAALLPPDSVLLDDLGARLRLSNADRKRLHATAARLSEWPKDVASLAYRVGAEAAVDALLLTTSPDDGTRLVPLLAQLESWRRPHLPISGRDLIALGVPVGPAVSRTLQAVERAWIEAGFPPSRERTLDLAKALLSPHSHS